MSGQTSTSPAGEQSPNKGLNWQKAAAKLTARDEPEANHPEESTTSINTNKSLLHTKDKDATESTEPLKLRINPEPEYKEADTMQGGTDSEEQFDRPKSKSEYSLPSADHRWHNFESQHTMASHRSYLDLREGWSNRCEFVMSCITSAVGLGNIWRFPFIAAQNGGGAFLIPYLLVVLFIGRPLYIMELGMGQFTSRGPVKCWEMAPFFRGIGYSSVIASFIVCTEYCAILAWCLNYFVYSFMRKFPWDNQAIHGAQDFFDYKLLRKPNISWEGTDFWNGKGLDGPPDWKLTLGLFFAWGLTWLAMIGGVTRTGKLSYFLALFPYFILIQLLGASWSLEGAGDGILYFFTPQWDKLIVPQTWFHAIAQSFFSLGVGFGVCITFSSYNEFHHPILKDSLFICLMDSLASVLAGISLFALIGNASYRSGHSIASISTRSDSGLAFVTVPEVLSQFGEYPGPQFFSVSFFLMLIVLAIGSVIALVGTVVTGICDAFPRFKRWKVVTGVSILSFFIGLLYCCPSGEAVISIVDKHGVEMLSYILGLFELIGVVWVYGLRNFCNDMEFMTCQPMSLYRQISWGFVLPFLMSIIIIIYLASYSTPRKWPPIAQAVGWLLTTSIILVIPTVGFRTIQTRKSRFWTKRVKASFSPSSRWGPKDRRIYEAWRRWKKAKPVEYAWTTRIMYRLGLRDTPYSPTPNDIWNLRKAIRPYRSVDASATTSSMELTNVVQTVLSNLTLTSEDNKQSRDELSLKHKTSS